MKRNRILKSGRLKLKISRLLFAASASALACMLALCAALTTNAQVQTASQEPQMTFANPQVAAESFIAAVEKFDETSLMQILGPNGYVIIHSGETVVDKEIAAEFASLARTKMNVVIGKRNRNLAFITVGDDSWQFPVPIIKKGRTWFFDTDAGLQEILYRRVGRNELDAIDICRGYVEAQREYSLTKHDGALVNQYAQRIISSPGKQDGLAWQNAEGRWGGTVGERAAMALETSFTGKEAPFHGYYFRILKKQGPAAHLGELDFVVKDAMIGGFALLAYPATYRITGVKTFIVSHEGVVYEKDLGPETTKLAQSIDAFNPDKTWSPVFDDVQ
jgi:hypothetical protein